MDQMRRQRIVLCLVLVSSVLALAGVASSQPPSPSKPPSPSATPPAARPPSQRAATPTPKPPSPRAAPKPLSPPTATAPSPRPPSPPATSPAPKTSSSPPSAAPAPRQASSPPAATPTPRTPPSPPTLRLSSPPAATPATKSSPSTSPAPRPSPRPPTPPPAPKPSPPPAPTRSKTNSSPATSSPGQLSPSFYSLSCPSVELAVRDVVRSASTLDPTIPGKLLRMLFHDCFVEGCDASVLIQGSGTERTDPANLSLGGFNVIDSAKRLLEAICPATVSCSDILVLAARDAVTLTGGPLVPVALGRRDGLVSLASNVRANIIDTGFSVDAMARSFAAKGLTLDDLVTLSGGHTIGSAHCTTFGERFRVDSNGSTVPVDEAMNADYAGELIRACSAVNGTVSSSTTVDCDEGSASRFDNTYFANLLDGRGLLRTDAVLVQNATTRATVEAFARSEESFFASWSASFARLTSLGVKIAAEGEVRRSCSRVNG
ncbi:hypothetical protein ABZP36_004132 [Zizania latifolia]